MNQIHGLELKSGLGPSTDPLNSSLQLLFLEFMGGGLLTEISERL